MNSELTPPACCEDGSRQPPRRLRRRRFGDNIGFVLLAVPLALFVLFILYMFFYLFRNGLGVINWQFLTQAPTKGKPPTVKVWP